MRRYRALPRTNIRKERVRAKKERHKNNKQENNHHLILSSRVRFDKETTTRIHKLFINLALDLFTLAFNSFAGKITKSLKKCSRDTTRSRLIGVN